MFSNPVSAAFSAVDDAVEALGALDWDGLPVRERLEALDRLETVRRKASACSLDLLGSVERCGAPALGGVSARVIADVIRISPREARHRIRDAAQLHTRTMLTGQTLPPSLPATAKAWNAGLLDVEHLRTEPLDQPLRIRRADAFDQTRAEIALHPRLRIRWRKP